MGIKHRFRFSDMIPNAWFYKLKDNMSKPRNTTSSSDHKFIKRNKIQKQQPFSSNSLSRSTNNKPPPPSSSSQPGCSSYFVSSKPEKATTDHHHKLYNSPVNPKASDTQFPDQPRRSSTSSRRRKTIYKPSPKLHHHIQYSPDYNNSSSPFESSILTESDDEYDELWSTPDIIIDVKDRSFEVEPLPPIMTRPRNKSHHDTGRKSTTKKRSIRVKSNSPRLARRKSKGVTSYPSPLGRRRCRAFAESFAVVKSSMDPERDFMDSMVEMIVENDIKGAKELEELLACYLSLNLDKYHDVIVRAFEQIWFHMA